MELRNLIFRVLVLTNLIAVTIYYISGSNWEFKFQQIQQIGRHLSKTVGRKKILLWNSPNRIETSAFGTGHQAFINANCPVSDCEIVANTNEFASKDYRLLADFDAILMNMHVLIFSSLLPQNYSRPERQRFVFFTQESPLTMAALGLDVAKLGGVFNWTMTYRMDSDIRLLYGRVHDRSLINSASADYYNNTNTTEIIDKSQQKDATMRSNKTGKVVWMASHCETLRCVFELTLR